MKRKFAWLMLPLMLGALMWGVKWRAEHPPVTKWDLQVRSLLSQTSMTVIYSAPRASGHRITLRLSEKEKRAFLDCFHLSPQVSNMSHVPMVRNDVIDILCQSDTAIVRSGRINFSIIIGLNYRIGKVDLSEPGNSKVYDLHPATTKLWLESLLNDPRIGPALRQRLQ